MQFHIVVTGPNRPGAQDLYRIVAVTHKKDLAQKYHDLIMENEDLHGRPMVKSIIGQNRHQNNKYFVETFTRELLES